MTSVTRAAPSTMYSWLLTDTTERNATRYTPPGSSQRHSASGREVDEDCGVTLAASACARAFALSKQIHAAIVEKSNAR